MSTGSDQAARRTEGGPRGQDRPDHRHHRPGRLVPGRAAARARATRCTAWCAARRPSTPSGIDHIYQDPHEPNRRLFLHYGDLTDGVALVNLLRDMQPRRGLQPGRAVARPGLVRRAGVHRRRHRASARCGCWRRSGPAASTPGSTRRPPRRCSARRRRRRTSARPFHPRSPYGCAKVYALLGDGQLPRGVRPVRGQRHPVQPRVPAPRRDLRDPQDHPRGRPDPGRPPGQALPGQPRRGPRLGLRAGVRRGHVADAPARRAGRLRGRHRRGRPPCGSSWQTAFAARRPGLGASTSSYDQKYERPTEVDALIGDAGKAETLLGWKPTGLWPELAGIMVDADIARWRPTSWPGATVRIDR